jgi:hypothetical protein
MKTQGKLWIMAQPRPITAPIGPQGSQRRGNQRKATKPPRPATAALIK